MNGQTTSASKVAVGKLPSKYSSCHLFGITLSERGLLPKSLFTSSLDRARRRTGVVGEAGDLKLPSGSIRRSRAVVSSRSLGWTCSSGSRDLG